MQDLILTPVEGPIPEAYLRAIRTTNPDYLTPKGIAASEAKLTPEEMAELNELWRRFKAGDTDVIVD